MLQDPYRTVLAPMQPEEAAAYEALEVDLSHGDGTLTVTVGDRTVELSTDIEPHLADDAYEKGCRASEEGDAERAIGAFMGAALGDGPAVPGLYAMAAEYCWMKSYGKAAAISGLITALDGYTDPRASALAGYASFCLEKPKETRRFLALAARRCRGKREFRNVQRFCQEILLKQQFGSSDDD